MGAEPAVVELSTRGDGPARLQLLEDVERQLKDIGWPTGDCFGIQMAIEEVVSNAYHHGNHEGQLGLVDIRWSLGETEFWMEVADQGTGFDESSVPDPTSEDHLEDTTGRGLLLIRNFMSEVKLEDRGRRVVMKKVRSDA